MENTKNEKQCAIHDVKGSLKDILTDLAKLNTDLYMGEDVYGGKDGENMKYREHVDNIREKIKVMINCL
jgi:hypothetical protein